MIYRASSLLHASSTNRNNILIKHLDADSCLRLEELWRDRVCLAQSLTADMAKNLSFGKNCVWSRQGDATIAWRTRRVASRAGKRVKGSSIDD